MNLYRKTYLCVCEGKQEEQYLKHVPDVRRIYGLGSETDIKSKRGISKILTQITLNNVKSAIERANKIRVGKLDIDKTVIGSSVCYSNPDFSIHEFLKAVLADCGEYE